MTYNIGDVVEIAGHKGEDAWLTDNGFSPEGILFFDTYDTLPPDDEIIWTKVTIAKTYGEQITVYYNMDKRAAWHVFNRNVDRFIRPCGKAQSKVPVAESCVECKTQFPYPNEHNCSEGRVCYSCRSAYAWKYTFTQ